MRDERHHEAAETHSSQIQVAEDIFRKNMGRSLLHRMPLPPKLRAYWEASRAPRYSILLALPLLIAYEALATFLSNGPTAEVRNGADVLLRELFLTVAGRRFAPLAFGVTVIGISVWYIARDVRGTRSPFQAPVVLAMLAESAVLAVAFGRIIGWMTSHLVGAIGPGNIADAIVGDAVRGPAWTGGLAGAPTATKVMLALGAGVYEEIVFRVLLVSAIAFLAGRVLGWRPLFAAGFAAILSAVIFAAFHYVGPYGDPFRLDSFVFRFLGGLAFSLLYVTRGFGITAWTHTLYDLIALTV